MTMKPVKINILKDFFNERRQKLFLQIIQCGAGGNGSYVVQQLAQMLSIFDVDCRYIIADNDVYEAKNKRNQLILDKDIGEKKARVLSERYRGAFQVDIGYYDHEFVESAETLEKLFKETPYYSRDLDYVILPVLLGCVDNNYSRQIFHKYFEEAENLLYIDVGIESAVVPPGKSVSNMAEWTEEEVHTFKNTGFTGQVVAGLKLNGETVVEPLAEVFPDVLKDNDTIAPSEEACSTVVISNPQRVLTNRLAAHCMCTYLNEFFESGTLSNHVTFFHSKKNIVRTEPIKMNM
ncbi:ThiF family adenylyltransferase [Pontibacillus halophilus]|uniref:ThiF family adenylyltransferase n=1 Tax=Pontibacillus halophilus TaxID=516704 RepID=UPI000401CB59|nr:ThiF family adenylyltransferase [Pontibacillus halophilus]